MSMSTKNITQGGQILAYQYRMFLQINNKIGFWIFMMFLIITGLGVFLVTPLETIQNGSWYWFANINKSFLFLSENDTTTYDIKYFYAPTKVMYTLKMTMTQMLGDPYMIAMGEKLWNRITYTSMFSGGFSISVFCLITWYIGKIGKEQSSDEILSGMELTDDPKVVNKLLKENGECSDLSVYHLHLVKQSEILNLLMHGTISVGKSTIIRYLLKQIRERGDRAIIWDSGCTFVESNYRPDKDFLMNPYDERCANWHLWGECSNMPDYDNMANSLIPVEGESTDPFWVSSARTIFSSAASQMDTDPEQSIEKFLRVLLSLSIKNLRSYLEHTEAASLVDEKIEKTAISIRSVITNYAKSLRYLQGLDRSGKPRFTIRDWMTNPAMSDSWLFISANAQQKSSLRPLISMWLSLATINLMSMGQDAKRRVWFILDELPGLQKLPELPGVMAEARKFGGCFVIGIQNMPQLIQIYGRNMGESLFDLLNTRFYGRSPSATVAKLVEAELGMQRRKEAKEQYSYGPDQIRDGVSLAKDKVREPIVDYDQIMRLPNLNFYVRLPGEYPVTKLKLKYLDSKNTQPALILRNFNESLNPEIEKLVQHNERAASAANLIFPINPYEEGGDTVTAKPIPEPMPAVNVEQQQPDPSLAPISEAPPLQSISPVRSDVIQPSAEVLDKVMSTPVSQASVPRRHDALARLWNNNSANQSNTAQDDTVVAAGGEERITQSEKREIEQRKGIYGQGEHDIDDINDLLDRALNDGDAVSRMQQDEKNILRHHTQQEIEQGGYER
ncbi:coupling protein TraD (plasmid) [Serratia plymuthica 4Rx13]|uniref:Type IV conjugative transfer system coupling protein TraD n=1 Tax=Serratia plymuthica TaxID=82996 RepID=A0A318NS84_SERPL|nr:type IV conjugative transfer system coupling protein TraD [Serratia plymuthica]AGO57712.1 coupling protein TraD [Serratia plymuthica 4Rx13]PYD36604.1 type IV conjugative transfer system coupling protein TraD [Serratia plymuthica]